MTHTSLSPFAVLAFAALAGCASNATGPSASLTASHTFSDKNGLVILPTKINDGEPLLFLLDTGASPCVLDSTVAAQRGIATGEATERLGGAGTFTSGVTKEPVRLTVGADVLTCKETIVVDLSGLTEVTGAKLGGIIGGDFFRGRVVEIDYDRDVLAVHDRNTYHHRKIGQRIPIRIEKNRPWVKALLSVPGGPQDRPRELMVDSGSLDAVDDALLKEGTGALTPGTAQGLGSGAEIKRGTFSKVVIGTHEFTNVVGYVPSVPIVGAGILARFNLVFDYDGGWMIFNKRSTKP